MRERKKVADSEISMGKTKRLRRRLQLHKDGKVRVCGDMFLCVFFWEWVVGVHFDDDED